MCKVHSHQAKNEAKAKIFFYSQIFFCLFFDIFSLWFPLGVNRPLRRVQKVYFLLVHKCSERKKRSSRLFPHVSAGLLCFLPSNVPVRGNALLNRSVNSGSSFLHYCFIMWKAIQEIVRTSLQCTLFGVMTGDLITASNGVWEGNAFNQVCRSVSSQGVVTIHGHVQTCSIGPCPFTFTT